MSCLPKTYLPHEHNQPINESIDKSPTSLSFCWRIALRSPSVLSLEYSASLNCQPHWKNTDINFRLQFKNISIREIDDYFGEKASKKRQTRQCTVEWFVDWLSVFVWLVVMGQIGPWLLDLGGVVLSFFSALSLIPVWLAIATIANHPMGTILGVWFSSPQNDFCCNWRMQSHFRRNDKMDLSGEKNGQ